MERLVKVVYGHCTTWRIYKDADGFFCVCNKRYGTIEKAHRAIRIAEQSYIQDNPNAPLANDHIWFDHGMLIVDNVDGNYYD